MKKTNKTKMIITMFFIILSAQSCEKAPIKPHDPSFATISLEIVDSKGNNLMAGIKYDGDPKLGKCEVSSIDFSSSNDSSLSTNPLGDPQIAYLYTRIEMNDDGSIPSEVTCAVVCAHIFNDASQHNIIIKGDKSSTYWNFISKSVIFEGKEYPLTYNKEEYEYHAKVILDR